MRPRTTRILLGSLAAVLATLSAASCTDEKIVFKDRELFEEPLPAAAGALGYSDQASKLTTCGNCHVGPQSQWQTTAHANAWQDLQDSGGAQAFCEGCHTVNEFGNTAVDPMGFTATGEDRYQDVQCESCHGPGLAHVQAPGASQPLAAMDVGLDNTEGCGECHQGTHHPFVEQWAQSGHANLGFQAARDGCKDCHSGNGALTAKFGVQTAYLEEGESFPITCAVCHDPHGSPNEAQLRFPIGGPGVSVEDNLCAQCHNRRTAPDPTSSHGLSPHSPEAALLDGDVGWFPPDLEIDRGRILTSHGVEGNEGLCATCHVAQQTIVDDGGNFEFQAVGHTFDAIPCLDASGIPTAGDCGLNLEERTFAGCATGGCHGNSETAALNALRTASASLQAWVDVLKGLLEEVDPNLDGAGGEIDANDGKFTVAEGAFFNMSMAEFGGSGRPDALLAFTGTAAHNPFLSEQLLIASIRAIQDTYQVQAAPDLVLEPRIGMDR